MEDKNNDIYLIKDLYRQLDNGGIDAEKFEEIQDRTTGPCQTVKDVIRSMAEFGEIEIITDTNGQNKIKAVKD